MAPFIVALLVLSLTTNVIPLFNVVAILGLFVLRVFRTKAATPDRRLGPRTAVHFLLAAYAFWILSYALTTAPLSNLFSYDFLRFNGAVLVGYLPLLLLGDVGLSPRFVYRLIWVYLAILAGVALLGGVLLLLLGAGHRFFLGIMILNNFLSFETGHGMPVMLNGMYRTHMTTGNQYAMAALMTLCFLLRKETPKLLSWPGLVFASLLAALIFSGARTAYVAFAAALLFQFASKKRYSRPLAKIGALILVPTILFCLSQPTIIMRISSIVQYAGDSNVETRFRLYQTALEDFADSPVIGIGFGRFSNAAKTYFGLRHLVYVATGGEMEGDVALAYQAHDSYLHFLAEGGLVGLFLMLGVWVATYGWAGRIRREFPDGSIAAVLCEAVQASVLVTFFSSLTGTTMMMATTPLFVFTMVGLLRNVVAWECKTRGVQSTSSVGFRGLSQLVKPAAI